MHLDDLYNDILLTGSKKMQRVWKNLLQFEQTVISSPASEKTHYYELDEFNKPIQNHIHKLLNKFGFVNGNPEANKNNHAIQILWWLYQETNNAVYRQPCLSADVANHHASAADRKKAILMSIDLLKNLIKRLYKVNG
jgi:hypothetical protein